MKQRSTIITAIVFLLAGTGAGVIANYTWYGLDWVKKPDVITQGSIKGPRQGTGTSEANGGSTAAQGDATSQSTPADDPCEARPGDEPMTVRMECVLEFLEKGGAYFVDAREEHEYSPGHLRNSIHIPASDAISQMGNIMAAGAQVIDPIIVYCGGGECEASHIVARVLRENSFQRVFIYSKGWAEIESSGKFSAYTEAGNAN